MRILERIPCSGKKGWEVKLIHFAEMVGQFTALCGPEKYEVTIHYVFIQILFTWVKKQILLPFSRGLVLFENIYQWLKGRHWECVSLKSQMASYWMWGSTVCNTEIRFRISFLNWRNEMNCQNRMKLRGTQLAHWLCTSIIKVSHLKNRHKSCKQRTKSLVTTLLPAAWEFLV